MLIENTLFGAVDKVDIAIKRIKEFEPPEGYYLAFSGGKDSQCIYHLAIEAGVKFEAHYHVTTVDPPELIKFITKNYKSVIFDKPKYTMWQLIQKNLTPPLRTSRYCCGKLKETKGHGRVIMLGVRWQESSKRNGRKIIENCMKNKAKIYVNPIVDWKNEDVWEYLNRENMPHCELYDKGYKRIGCIMCPMKGRDIRLREMIRYPRIALKYHETFKKMLVNRKKRGLVVAWKKPEDVMEWWIYGKENNDTFSDPDQAVMFE